LRVLHHGYAGRKAAGSNLAYPLSPNLVSFKRDDGNYRAIVPGAVVGSHCSLSVKQDLATPRR
jgi:hypothetical protein